MNLSSPDPASLPGRSCPVSYQYATEAFSRLPRLEVDTLWIAGGLYGNTFALESLLQAYDAEAGTKALVFNGDFHWFDVDPADFRRINDSVLRFQALRGNVETELASPGDGAGCGCGYPEWVDQATVEHSNRIVERLRATAIGLPGALAPLAALPTRLAAEVGDTRIGIVHGDAESLAGWGFSQETLATPQGISSADAAFSRAGMDVFACSHTCLPVLQRFEGDRVVVNNGAAGMPNFRGTQHGLATRISVHRRKAATYAVRQGRVWIEAIPLPFDEHAWQARFLEQWPPGSDAHRSYWERITRGPSFRPDQALRG